MGFVIVSAMGLIAVEEYKSVGYSFSGCSSSEIKYEGRCIDPEVSSKIVEELNRSGSMTVGRLAAKLGIDEWRVFVEERRNSNMFCYVSEPGGFLTESVYRCEYRNRGEQK